KTLEINLAKLNSLGVTLDDVRYSNYESKTGEVIYRNYIAGFPIVSEYNYGTYSLQNVTSNGQRFMFSLYGLQVPLPNTNKQKTLPSRSEEHTSELQSRFDLVCRLLLEKKKKNT